MTGIRALFVLFVMLGGWVHGVQPSSSSLLSIQGYAGPDQAIQLRHQADMVPHDQPIILEIQSTSGDLRSMLELAQHLYELKLETGQQIVVYLSNRVLGPAALLPFLADEIIATPYLSWGAIPQQSDSTMALNVMRNQVVSLISPKNPKADLLTLMAQAMVDDTVVVIDDKGWKLVKDAPVGANLISHKGETLVVSHDQLRIQGIVTRFLTQSEFDIAYGVTTAQAAIAPQAGSLSPALMARLVEHIHPDMSRPVTVGHIAIADHDAGINQGTWLMVKSALDIYKVTKPAFIILELNTPGGEVFAAQQISDALKDMDTQYKIPIVAYINNWAISAGAMLAYSCRFIVIARDAAMGAAEPVLQSSEGTMVAASEKVNSALRADFANRASFFGRDPLIAEAMVDKDIILVKRHGKIVKLDSDSEIRKGGDDPDVVINAKGKLLTLKASELISLGVADMVLEPISLPPITHAQLYHGKWPASEMALFHQPFFDKFADATIDSYRPDWRVQFFTFLAKPMVSSLLFLGLFLGFYIEMNHPGLGLPGGIAVLCLFLIMLSSFALEAANWLEMIFIVVGLVLVGVELFVLPTFGIAGFVGLVMVIGGLFALVLPGIGSVSFDYDSNTWNAAGDVVFERLAWLCGSLVLSLIIIVILARYVMPRVASKSRFVLNDDQEGYIAGPDPKTLPQPGSKGIVAATLRPSGRVIVNDVGYDAVSEGGFIEQGTPIIVLRLEGSKIVVTEESEELNSP